MNEYIREIVLAGLGFAVGMAVGQFLSFRRKGRVITIEVEAKEVWMKIVRQVSWIVVVLVFVASVGQSVAFTYGQRKCNAQVVNTLQYRSAIADEVAKINDARDKAMRDLIQTILTASQTPNPAQTVHEALTHQSEVTAELNRQAEERKQTKNAAPFPKCD